MNQEPGTEAEIFNCIKYVRPGGNYVPNFELTETVDVNGPTSHLMMRYLRQYCPSPRRNFAEKDTLLYDLFDPDDIRWNFEKFLLDRNGRPVLRYRSSVEPIDIAPDVERLIQETSPSKHLPRV
jgi:glutathione peroxidase